MPSSPKQAKEKLDAIIKAWGDLRPAKKFAGMTLEEFKTKVKPAYDSRATISTLENQMTAAIDQRDKADKAAFALTQFVVNAVKGDPEEGEDGELYDAMGYVRKSERESGLAKRPKTQPSPETK